MSERNERTNPVRDFGRDGISGMVNRDRAIRALEVSRPGPADIAYATGELPQLLARAQGRKTNTR